MPCLRQFVCRADAPSSCLHLCASSAGVGERLPIQKTPDFLQKKAMPMTKKTSSALTCTCNYHHHSPLLGGRAPVVRSSSTPTLWPQTSPPIPFYFPQRRTRRRQENGEEKGEGKRRGAVCNWWPCCAPHRAHSLLVAILPFFKTSPRPWSNETIDPTEPERRACPMAGSAASLCAINSNPSSPP